MRKTTLRVLVIFRAGPAWGSGPPEDQPDWDAHADWVDALIGLRFRAPLGSRVSLLGRGDIAGFGSKFTWNLEGDLAVKLSDRWSLGAGWRHIDIEYDKTDGAERRLYDVALDGPRTWFSYAW